MNRTILKLFWGVTWRYKRLFLASELGAVLLVLSAEVAAPFIVSQVVDKLAQANAAPMQFSDFMPFLWIYAGIRAVQLVGARLMMQTYLRLEPNAVRDLENLSLRKLHGHSMAFFADNFTGGLVAKVSRFTGAYQRLLETSLEFAQLVYRYVAILVVILILNPLIAAVFLVWTLIFSFSIAYLHRRKLRHSQAAAAAQTRVTARLADIIMNTLTIRSFARFGEERKRFEALTQERRNLRVRSYLLTDRIRMYKSVTIFVLNVTVLALSVYFGLKGELGVGSVILIQLFLFQLLTQLWNLGRFMDRTEEALADAAEMTEIIMQPHEIVDRPEPEECRIREGAVEFKGVTFAYGETGYGAALLNDLSFRIESGQKVGLVGPSGGGKTTLTKLLLRLMDVDGGEILIDGQNIAQMRQDDLHRNVAYVPQEPLLFHRTIFENIAYGNPEATREQVVEVARKAHADEFIQLLEDGYDTVVGERGVKLSGGQRQRVAIARALLKDAPILVLDEATSSLDSVSERLITDAMASLMAGRTTIVVAHRLSTVRKMDRILVVRDGAVVEDGSHTDLVKRKGLYARLWAHQSDSMLADEAD